ncbi:HEL112Cp [Eremothecium sinecaudum]|uniref:HEL112Cp n=1 Tax=Eremothecium sinecaudum TaxID=45286 RepID=A0A109UZQ6_9SACH|nr:HEL112Cp [Eremothecium sinecaudum]AMD21168.1 HEL112Cp [Eremothecium sinecaudum]
MKESTAKDNELDSKFDKKGKRSVNDQKSGSIDSDIKEVCDKLDSKSASLPIPAQSEPNKNEEGSSRDPLGGRLSTSNEDARKVKSHLQLSSTAHGVRMLSKNISNTKVNIEVENLMIVTKKQDTSLIYLTREMVEWILVNFPTITVYVDLKLKTSKRFNASELIKDANCADHKIKYWTPELVNEHKDFFDLVVTLGGDGTVLFISSLFQREVPPIMSFSLGSLGFLTIFKYENFKEDLTRVLQSRIRTRMRMRLYCKVYRRNSKSSAERKEKNTKKYELISSYHVLNELAIDRGPSPFLSMLELYGDNSLLTVTQADGLIIATPTGSTAYSLSAGGSLMYPSVNAIAVTPICPHTLSFRPIILPDSMTLKVKVPMNSRATAWAAFDGKNRVELLKGDYISVAASPYALPTLESSPTEFIDSIRRTLNWNAREPQKSFAHMLSVKNQLKYDSDACDKVVYNSSESDDEVIPSKTDVRERGQIFKVRTSSMIRNQSISEGFTHRGTVLQEDSSREAFDEIDIPRKKRSGSTTPVSPGCKTENSEQVAPSDSLQPSV